MSKIMFYEINNQDLKKVIDIILKNFKENEEKINVLNVFPVPDGDTGTNMLLTLKAIKEELLISMGITKLPISITQSTSAPADVRQ